MSESALPSENKSPSGTRGTHTLGNGLEIRASWLPEGVTVEQVAAGLRPLLDKPVELVLPTHLVVRESAAEPPRRTLTP